MRIAVAIPRGTDEEQDQFILPEASVKTEKESIMRFIPVTTEIIQNRENSSQVLMHAVSEDLKHWTKTQDAVTFVPQPGYDPDDWRDPFVLWDDESENIF